MGIGIARLTARSKVVEYRVRQLVTLAAILTAFPFLTSAARSDPNEEPRPVEAADAKQETTDLGIPSSVLERWQQSGYDPIGRDRGMPPGTRESLRMDRLPGVPSSARPSMPVTAGAHPEPAQPPLRQLWSDEDVDEDVDEIRRLWLEQLERPPGEQKRAVEQYLALPGEPTQAHRGATQSEWEPIGSGIRDDKVNPNDSNDTQSSFHKSGRVRAAQYVYDDELGYTTLYVASPGGGVFRLRSFGVAFIWESVSDNMPAVPTVGAFLVDETDSSRILIGTGDFGRGVGSGLYRTLDGGATWHRTVLDPWPAQFMRIVQDSTDPETVLAVGNDSLSNNFTSGIWRSENFGNTWTKVSNLIVSDLVQDPAFPQFWLAGAPGSGVLESSDGGESFHLIGGNGGTGLGGAGTGRIAYAISQSDPSYHYLLAATGSDGSLTLYGIFRSTDFGYSWLRIDVGDIISENQGWHTGAIAVDPLARGRVFVGQALSLWTDNADAADPINICWRFYKKQGNPCGKPAHLGHPDFTSFVFVPQSIAPGNSRVVVTNDGGIYVYDWNTNYINGDQNLLGLNVGQMWPSFGHTLSAAHGDPTLALAGTFDNGVVKIDYDDTYSPILYMEGGGDGGATSISPDNADNFFVSWGVSWGRRLSTDGGSNWEVVDCTLASTAGRPSTLIDPTPGFGNVIYTHDSRTIYWKSLDTNCDWQPLSMPIGPPDFDVTTLDQANNPVEGLFYVSGIRPAPGTSPWLFVLRGNNLPLTAVDRTPPLVGSPTRVVVYADRSVLQPETVYLTTDRRRPSQAWMSTLGGEPTSWKNVTGTLAVMVPDANYRELVANPSNLNQLFLATSVGVLRSDNGGASWYRYMNGLPPAVDIRQIDLSFDNADEPELLIGTFGRGWWRRVIDEIANEIHLFSDPFESGDFSSWAGSVP